MIFHDKEYLSLLKNVLENGKPHEDRTGVGTIRLFGVQNKFDLREGFPLLTSKKMWLRGIIEELLWFLSGSTNAYDLPKAVQKWWTPWSDNDGTLGPVYGESLRAFHPHHEIIEIEPIEYKDDYEEEIREKLTPQGNNPFIGSVVNTDYGLCTVISESGKTENSTKLFLVQFENTLGTAIGTKRHILSGIKDRYAPTLAGVGYLGDLKLGKDDSFFFLRSIWCNMLRRCYLETNNEYHNYGAKGIRVAKCWHNFSNFCRDVQELPNWCFACKNRDFQLDKDYWGAKIYSPDTCVWLSAQENSMYTGQAIEAKSPDGDISYHINQTECGYDLELEQRRISYVLNGHRSNLQGYTFEYSDKYLRYPLPVDQIGELLKNIRNDPNSRRLIVSTWNPGRLKQMNLPSCHGLVSHFQVEDGVLNLHTVQRSADLFIGYPVNIASYAILIHIIGAMTNLTPGVLTYSISDAHVYRDHFDQVKEQLSREPISSPTLKVNYQGQGINNWSFDDFIVENYEPHPSISASIAV